MVHLASLCVKTRFSCCFTFHTSILEYGTQFVDSVNSIVKTLQDITMWWSHYVPRVRFHHHIPPCIVLYCNSSLHTACCIIATNHARQCIGSSHFYCLVRWVFFENYLVRIFEICSYVYDHGPIKSIMTRSTIRDNSIVRSFIKRIPLLNRLSELVINFTIWTVLLIGFLSGIFTIRSILTTIAILGPLSELLNYIFGLLFFYKSIDWY